MAKCNQLTPLLHLCKPILIYASQCVCNSRSDVLHVTKARNQLFYKLFTVSEQDCINDIQMFFGIKSIDDELCSRQDRFLRTQANSTNTVISVLCSLSFSFHCNFFCVVFVLLWTVVAVSHWRIKIHIFLTASICLKPKTKASQIWSSSTQPTVRQVAFNFVGSKMQRKDTITW